MEIFTGLMEYFEIASLGESATFVDLLNNFVSIVFAIFIIAFMLRSLFLACTVPFDSMD